MDYLKQMMERMQADIDRRNVKLDEFKEYLNGNPRGGVLVNCFDPTEEFGGYEDGRAYELVYVGSIVQTKYGDLAKIKAFGTYPDGRTQIIFEQEDVDPVDDSRISVVGYTEEDLQERERWARMSDTERANEYKRLEAERGY